ncbi:MAG: CCA tRNA nucleotidyltransferase [Candidatus Methanofastidiosia archaeon]|jgi:tRNA nucleotidyltransferase (CCA-adding enzyme)
MKEVLKKILPTEKERNKANQIIEKCITILEKRIKEKGITANVTLQGSMAKDTWISGDKNIDIFIIFPHEYSKQQLKKYGLELGVLSEYEIAYAEHPYVRNFLDGYEIDVVPAYQFKEGIRSSVDRTPLHTEYVKTHLKDNNQVRLLKKFTRSIGVYGSDLKVQGFAGYLCELLIITYDTFLNVLKAAALWRPKEVIILEEPPEKEFSEPFVVIDPVDKNRNVAAVVSLENFTRFVHHARKFLKDKDASYFFREPRSYTKMEGTVLYCIDFDTDIIDDMLFPQLRKTRDYMVNTLQKHGFRVGNTAVYNSGIAVELSVFELPLHKKHMGPPIGEKEHCETFVEKYKSVFIEKDKLYTIINRKYTTAEHLLKEMLKEKTGFGKDLADVETTLQKVSKIDAVIYD